MVDTHCVEPVTAFVAIRGNATTWSWAVSHLRPGTAPQTVSGHISGAKYDAHIEAIQLPPGPRTRMPHRPAHR